MVEFGRVPEKGRIRASTENCPDKYRNMVESGSIPKNDRILASTEKWKNQGQYRKMIESERIWGQG